MKIDFNPDGTARCLYTEKIDLRQLGRLTVSRASNVEFNESKQEWEVKDLDEKVLFTNSSRDICLGWESENLF